jgi:hypothetical protein
MHDAQEEQERRWKKKDELNLLIANVNRTDSQVEKLTKVIAAIGQTVLDHQDWIEKHS